MWMKLIDTQKENDDSLNDLYKDFDKDMLKRWFLVKKRRGRKTNTRKLREECEKLDIVQNIDNDGIEKWELFFSKKWLQTAIEFIKRWDTIK